jgi:hypothetical protein
VAVTAKKDYAAIAAAKIQKPSSQKRMPQILVYARNKKGKSTFCSTAPDVLMIDPENGTDHLKKADPSVWKVSRWEDFDEIDRYLRGNNHGFKWVCVDGVTRIHNMALRFVMQQQEERDLDRIPGFVQLKDYGKANELLKGLMLNFQALGVGVIYTAQERMQSVENMSEEDEEAEESDIMYVPDVSKGARSAILAMVDVIGRLYTVRTTKEVKLRSGGTKEKEYVQRRLWLGVHPRYDTGYRSDYELPDFIIDPTVPRLVEYLNNGKAGAK